MKIAVCLRRVPDTTTKIVIGADGKSINEAGVKFVPNPYDEYAVEAAIALKDTAGAGETVVVGFGGDSVQETLRTALAMGIDRAVHLQGAPAADGFANARVLAGALRDGGYDLILFGKIAVDDYGQQTGPMVAELLGIPCATAITSLTIADGKAAVTREVEGGVEMAECALPAAFSCDKGLNNPRLPSLKGIMAAKKKPMDIVPSTAEPGAVQVVSLTLPPERAAGKIVGEGAAAVPALVALLTRKRRCSDMARILAVLETARRDAARKVAARTPCRRSSPGRSGGGRRSMPWCSAATVPWRAPRHSAVTALIVCSRPRTRRSPQYCPDGTSATVADRGRGVLGRPVRRPRHRERTLAPSAARLGRAAGDGRHRRWTSRGT